MPLPLSAILEGGIEENSDEIELNRFVVNCSNGMFSKGPPWMDQVVRIPVVDQVVHETSFFPLVASIDIFCDAYWPRIQFCQEIFKERDALDWFLSYKRFDSSAISSATNGSSESSSSLSSSSFIETDTHHLAWILSRNRPLLSLDQLERAQ
ncbi:hypothetical protein Tco_1219658 [Tanacetum coccineum]